MVRPLTIPEFIDFDKLNTIWCDQILGKFLRCNAFVGRTFPIDFSEYTVKIGGDKHLLLEKKREYFSMINGFKSVMVCEDEPEAYEYWKYHFNTDPDDCCNLRNTGR